MARDYASIVEALFAKANAVGVTPQEKEEFERKAFELISKHDVTIIKKEYSDDKPIKVTVSFGGAYSSRQSILFNTIANHFNCKLIQSGANFYMVGYDSDITKVSVMYAVLENQMFYELSKVAIPPHVHAKTFKTSWLNGYIYRIQERLKEVRRNTTKAEEPGTGIVLYDRNKAVEKEFYNQFPKTVKKQGSRSKSYNAWSQGDAAGAKAQFAANDSVNGNGPKELH